MSVALQPGDVVAAKYEVLREIGRGGMGAVFEVRHQRLGRVFAMKILTLDAADTELHHRFEREARIGANLDSPHLVKVLDIDITSTGVPYLVMELLDGASLAEVLARENPSLDDLLRWSCHVAAGLEVAHAAGVVHRDLKPANIFIAHDANRAGTAKILDFGIAKILQEQLTQQGILGTPKYMSPEQLRGSTVDHRTDIFSLGVLLYTTLTKAVPYGVGKDGLPRVLTEAPTPIETYRTDLPPRLAHAIMRAIERDAQHRFATIQEMHDELLACRLISMTVDEAATLDPTTMLATRAPRAKVSKRVVRASLVSACVVCGLAAFGTAAVAPAPVRSAIASEQAGSARNLPVPRVFETDPTPAATAPGGVPSSPTQGLSHPKGAPAANGDYCWLPMAL